MNYRILAFIVGAVLMAPFAGAEPSTDVPVPIRTVAPSYPAELKDSGVSGIVLLHVVVDEQGNVTQPKVEKSTNPAFERPALEAVSKWRFRPAMQAGKPISWKVAVPIKFSTES